MVNENNNININEDLYGATCDLLYELDKMFDDPHFQSVFVAAGKLGVTYKNETLKDVVERVKGQLGKR